MAGYKKDYANETTTSSIGSTSHIENLFKKYLGSPALKKKTPKIHSPAKYTAESKNDMQTKS